MKSSSSLISVIFVYYNTPEEIKRAVESLGEAVGKYKYEVIIVDSDSPRKIPRSLLTDPNIKVVNYGNNGYGMGLNKGVMHSGGKYLVLSNSDVVYTPDSVSKLIKTIERDYSVGIIGPGLIDSKGNILKVGSGYPFLPDALFVFSLLGKLFPHNRYSSRYYLKNINRTSDQSIPALAGAVMVTTRNIFDRVGGFDERFFMYFEEADFCYRISKLGKKVVYLPSVRVIHYVGRSTKDRKRIRREFEKSRYKFLVKYHGLILGSTGELLIRILNRSWRL